MQISNWSSAGRSTSHKKFPSCTFVSNVNKKTSARSRCHNMRLAHMVVLIYGNRFVLGERDVIHSRADDGNAAKSFNPPLSTESCHPFAPASIIDVLSKPNSFFLRNSKFTNVNNQGPLHDVRVVLGRYRCCHWRFLHLRQRKGRSGNFQLFLNLFKFWSLNFNQINSI